jgi:hypothetical protein
MREIKIVFDGPHPEPDAASVQEAPIEKQPSCAASAFKRSPSVEYTITAAFLLAVVAGSFAVVILCGYGIAHLIASAL